MIKKNSKWRGKIFIFLLLFSLIAFFYNGSSPIQFTRAASGTFNEDFTTTTYMDGAETNTSGWGTGTIENSRKKPTIVGSIGFSLIGSTVDVFIENNYAYVTNQIEGLKIVNISDSSNPFIIGSYDTASTAQSVFVDGDYAFIADYEGDADNDNILILDISDPSNPSQLGYCSIFDDAGDAARDIVVSNGLAFVANNEGGFSIVNVTDPYNPSEISSKDTAGTALNLAIEGDYIYLADGTNGLVIIDINNPLIPTIATTYSTGISFATNIVIESNYAYVVDFDNGIIAVNVTDPTTPTFAGSWSKSGATDAYVCENYLYVTDRNDGFSVLDIANPTDLIFIHTLTLPGIAQEIVIDGFYAYLACQSGGLQIAQIADTYPAFAGSYDIPDSAIDVLISGSFAYVADGYSGLQILNVTNPSSPTLAGSYDTPDIATAVFISSGFAYVADQASGLQILDISDPSTPSFAGSYDTPDKAYDVFVSGGFAYVADFAAGLQIVNISNPSAPTYAGSYDTPHWAMGVFVSGDYAYVADANSGLQVLNITNPSSPSLAGSYDTPFADCVFVSGDYAYVADQAGSLQILDISDPSTPTFAGSFDTPYNAIDVFVSGGFAYVAEAHLGFQVLNVTNPSSPTLTVSYHTPNFASAVFVSGDYAYVASRDLLVLKFSNYRSRQFASPCVAQSNTVFSASSSTITSATLVANDNTPIYTSITYSLSADGGSNWESIIPGIEHVFSNTGDQLKWKAVLTTSDFFVTSIINNLSIDYITTLVAPSLDTPTDSYITDDYTPSFTWSGINGESNYLFQLDTTTSFTSPLLNITLPSSSTSYTPSSPLAADTYYWRVAGIDSEGEIGEFSNYRTLYIIVDANPPTINNPIDVSYEQGATGNLITWTPTDSNPYWFNITLNSILTSYDDPWLGGNIVMDIDGLPLGTHTVICYVYDLEGLMTSDTVEVEVTTTAPPTIDDVADFDYEEGTTGNSIIWHPSDSNPDYYSITRDGTIIDDGPWLGGDITIDIDGLAYGSYTYVCTVNDTEGQEASDIVIVTVTDSINPNLNSPGDVIYEEGDTGNNIIWVATDTNPATYIVYKDGTLYDTDTWISGSSIIISVDGLTSNQYNFTIVVVDQAGNSAKDTVIVGVTAAVSEYQMFSIFITTLVILPITLISAKRKRRRDL